MKYIHKYNAFEINELLNVSKKRRWPTFKTNRGRTEHTDYYFVYDLSKFEMGKYLNLWFTGMILKSKDGKLTYKDEMITLKKVDKETASHLYSRKYNPVTINIVCPTGAKFKQNEKGEDLYHMRGVIHSIDDSSYGIWWKEMTFSELSEIRLKLMQWVNAYDELNGDEFLDVCVSMGADEDSKDYN